MKGLRSILGGLVGLLILVLLAGGIFLLNIDPNDYKSTIIQLVKEKTGRTLHIEGDIQLNLWPQLEIRVNQVILENASNHDAFATLKQAFVQVKLLPLLQRQLAINSLVLEGASLALVRQADGHGNWEDLVTGTSEKNGGVQTWTLHELKIREAQLLWDDQVKKERYRCSEMNLDVLQNFTQVHLSTTFETPKIRQYFELNSYLEIQQAWVKLHGLSIRTLGAVLTGELQADHFLKDNMKLVGNLKLQWSPAQNHIKKVAAETEIEASLSKVNLNKFHVNVDHYSLDFPKLSIDLTQQKLEGKSFLLNIAGIKLSGDLKGTQLFTQALLSGQFNSEPFKLSQLFIALNLPQPAWKAQKTTLKTQFQVNASEVHLNQFIFQVEDHQLTIPQLRFHLTQQTVTSEVFSIDALGKKLAIKGKLMGREVFKQAQWRGEVVLSSSKLQEVLSYFAYPQWFLHQAYLKTQFSVTADDVLLTDVQVTLDEQQFSSPKVNFSRTSHQLTAEQWTSKILGVVSEGDLHVEPKPLNDYQIQGRLRIAEFNLRQLLEKLGKRVITTDQTVLSKVTLETEVIGNVSQLGFERFHLHWENSQLKGQFYIEDFKQPRMKFDLNLDYIDISRYLPPAHQDKTKSDFSLFSKQLHELDLEGSIKIAQLKMATLEMSGVTMVLKRGQKRVKDIQKN